MGLISIFKTDGSNSSNPRAASDYLYGKYCVLTDEQKLIYQHNFSLLKRAREFGDAQLEYEALYILKQTKGKRRDPPPQALTANRCAVEYAIENNPHKRKYVSGVIAHALEDTKKLQQFPVIEQEWREQVERLFFAGLPSDEHLIDWIRHIHQGNVENHFIVPRIHLPSGKYFNPTPPGCESDLNAIRDYLNLKYDLASPTDPVRTRLAQLPSAFDKKSKLKKEILKLVVTCIERNLVSSRQGIVELLNHDAVKKKFSISRVSVSDNFIRIHVTGKQRAIRLKGFLFTSKFVSVDTIPNAEVKIRSKKELLSELKTRLESVIEKRAQFNRERYSSHTVESASTSTMHHQGESSVEKVLSEREPSSTTPILQLPVPVEVPRVNTSNFLPLPDIDQNLKGWDRVLEMEKRESIAHLNALEAIRIYYEKMNQVVSEIMHSVKNNNYKRGSKYDVFRTTINRLHNENAQRLRTASSSFTNTITGAVSVLRSHYKAIDDRVSVRANHTVGQVGVNPQYANVGIQGFSNAINQLINRCRESINLSKVVVEEAGRQVEQVGKLADGISQLDNTINRAIARIAMKERLKLRLRARLDNNTRKHEEAKVNVLTRGQVQYLIKGKTPLITKSALLRLHESAYIEHSQVTL